MNRAVALGVVAGLVLGCSRDKTPLPPSLPPPGPPKTSLDGGAWLTTQGGEASILRGLPVYLLKARVPRNEVDGTIDRLLGDVSEARVYFTKLGEKNWADEIRLATAQEAALKSLKFAPPDQPIDIRAIYAISRAIPLTSDGLEKDKRLKHLDHDSLWPEVVKGAGVNQTITNIEGKFRFDDLSPGSYYLYASTSTPRNLVEWLVHAEVVRGDRAERNLYNDTAVLILER